MTTPPDSFLPDNQEPNPTDVDGLVDQAMGNQNPPPSDAGANGSDTPPAPATQPQVITPQQYAALAHQNQQLQQLVALQAQQAQQFGGGDDQQQPEPIETLEQYGQRLDQILPRMYQGNPEGLQEARQTLMSEHEVRIRAAQGDATQSELAAMRQQLERVTDMLERGGNGQAWEPELQYAALNMASTMAGMLGSTFDASYVFQGLQNGTLQNSDPQTYQMVSDIMQGVNVGHDLASAQPIIRANIRRRAGLSDPNQNGQAGGVPPTQQQQAPGMPPTPPGGGASTAQGRRFNSLEEVTDEYLRDGTTMTTAEFDSYVAQFSA